MKKPKKKKSGARSQGLEKKIQFKVTAAQQASIQRASRGVTAASWLRPLVVSEASARLKGKGRRGAAR